MSRVLFLAENVLTNWTELSDNVDPKYIRPAMRRAMDKYIQPILGTNLYNVLEANIQTSSGNMSANNYKLLMDNFILPALKEWTLYEMRYYGVKLRNKGMVTQSSENSEALSLNDMERIGNYYKDSAEWYSQRLVNYLVNNGDLFPEYDNNTEDQIQSQKNVYSHGWYLNDSFNGCSDETWMK